MSRELSANTTLSHYRIVEKLGAGGMGEVWLAEDTRLKRKVALKLLPAELTADAERVRRFEQEAQAASALSHPNIITVYDIGDCEAGRFIVMELVAGHTLRSIIARDNPTETLFALVRQIAKALAAAHAAGITHRDIKPDNIMVRDDGYVKILDFGLARLRPATESDSAAATLALQTTPGTVMGTVAYMSPEQARGERVNHPSDIFALGIVLYELATGRHPFKAETLVGYLHAITLQEPEPLTKWKPELPASLNALILRMLSKDADLRPTASEVAQTLQEIERSGDTLKSPINPQHKEDATMMLAAGQTSAPREDEGFWVAVLPFKWRGASAELEALAEGLSEDIVTGLSRFSYLRVIARGSTLKYASDSGDVRTIGKELGARYVMEGSLRQAGTKLRLAVQLVDATTGAHLWAENYERTFSPEAIFELQDDLVPRIVSTVADHYGALVHSMSESLRGRSADQYSAHEAVLRAFGYWERVTPEEHREAREMLEAAVARAPGHSDCLAMLSTIYWHEYAHGYNVRPDPLGRAYATAQQAVAAAPASPLAHYVLATVLFFQKDFLAFRPAAERALALNRMDASTTAALGFLLAYAGDWEYGLDLVERAMQLNPHHPGWYHLPAFYDAYRRHDYRGALAWALKINVPGYYWPHVARAVVYGQLGEQERARAALRELQSLMPNFGAVARVEFGKWFDAELTEHLLDGLRKAGLKIGEAEQASIPTSEPETVSSSSRPEASPAQSIAVLPFANISAEEENEYFCDGLAEELLNALAKIDELKVAARTSAFSFKGKNREAREIGKTLNVNTVLEGSVRKAGNRIRINVQLVNAADGYHLWSERYDREMKDIFDVQDEITLAVVDALKVKLLGEEKSALLKHHTSNADAYEFYLRGLSYFNRWTPDDFQKAIESFRQAIAIDPHYASAYAALSNAYTEMAFFSFSPPDEWMPKAKEATNKALELDDTLGEAHNSMAIIKMYYDRDYAGAEREFTRALSLDPRSAHIHMRHGWYLGLMGRFDEGLKALQQAWELDPLSDPINFGMGVIFHWSRQPERAIGRFRKILELNPNYAVAYSFLAEAYEQKGDFVSALATIERLQRIANDPLTLSTAGYVYAKSGDQHKALEILNELERRSNQGYVAAPNFAQVYAGLGDSDQALVWLDKACSERSLWMTFLKVDPKFDLLSFDPRFTDLLRRVGLLTEEPPQADESLESKTKLPAPANSGEQTRATATSLVTQRHMVGRERERHELRAAFHAANDGRGALLCVVGEPGIGKTTLVEDFLAELTARHQCAIGRGRCSERLAGTEAYLPLLEALESLLESDQSLAATMKQIAPTWYAQVAPLPGDSEESTRLLNEVKAASQERMKRELASFLAAVATPQPLVIFFDDLHWADVSTIDLLSFLAGKFDALRVLIVVTYRPSDMLLAKHPFLQIKPDLQARGSLRELSLEFLTEAEIADYLALEFPRHAFSPDFARLIHAKTEGSPLFMADLVRYLRDRNVIAQSSGSWKLEQTLPDIERELPESVRGMIERKIAQLSEEDRKLLTTASVQGYEFDSAAVAEVLKLDAVEVEERLEKLERVFAFVKLVSEGEFPNRTLTLKYRFVHVLYQNALFNTLRHTRKASLSREIAETLETFYGAKKAEIASELATLFETGREFAKAADYFLMAAEHANQLFAAQEATTLARRGIEIVRVLPETSERAEQELRLQVSLGLSLRASKGFGHEETRLAYARAREICHQIANSPQLFPTLHGFWETYDAQAKFETAKEIAHELLTLAGEDSSLLVTVHHALADSLTMTGEFSTARQHIEKGLALYDPSLHHLNTDRFGYDSGMACMNYGTLTLWHLGYPDQAQRMIEQAVKLASRLAHPVNVALAAVFDAWFHCLNRSLPQAQEAADRAIEVSTEYDLALFLAFAKAMRGWALMGQREIASGIASVHEGLREWQATGALALSSLMFGVLAEGYLAVNQTEEAMRWLDEGFAFAAQTGERIYEAELWRLKGEILMKAEPALLVAEAEECFRQAIAVAQQQSAKSLELRATISLARLWQRQGKSAEAQQRLAEIYGCFTEGFDTADMQEAKALLNDLS